MTDAPEIQPHEPPEAVEQGSPMHDAIVQIAQALDSMIPIYGAGVLATGIAVHLAGQLVHMPPAVVEDALMRLGVMVRMNRESMMQSLQKEAN